MGIDLNRILCGITAGRAENTDHDFIDPAAFLIHDITEHDRIGSVCLKVVHAFCVRADPGTDPDCIRSADADDPDSGIRHSSGRSRYRIIS